MRSATVALGVVAAMLAQTVPAADTQGAANVELVKTYVRAVRIATFGNNPDQDLRPVAERYVSEDYVEHTYPMDRPGREGYIQMMLKRPRQGAIPRPRPMPRHLPRAYDRWMRCCR